MLIRKIVTAMITTIVMLAAALSYLAILDRASMMGDSNELFLVVFIFAIYIVPAIFLYGIMSSLLIEVITRNLNGVKQWVSSGTLHLVAGFLFIFFISLFFNRDSNFFHGFDVFWEQYGRIGLISTIVAAIFFGIDLVLRHRKQLKQRIKYRKNASLS